MKTQETLTSNKFACPGCLGAKRQPNSVAVHTDLCVGCAARDERRGHYHRRCECSECQWSRHVAYFASCGRLYESSGLAP
jgi:hypothetical protein